MTNKEDMLHISKQAVPLQSKLSRKCIHVLHAQSREARREQVSINIHECNAAISVTTIPSNEVTPHPQCIVTNLEQTHIHPKMVFTRVHAPINTGIYEQGQTLEVEFNFRFSQFPAKGRWSSSPFHPLVDMHYELELVF